MSLNYGRLNNLHFAYCPLSAMLESRKENELCNRTALFNSQRVIRTALLTPCFSLLGRLQRALYTALAMTELSDNSES